MPIWATVMQIWTLYMPTQTIDMHIRPYTGRTEHYIDKDPGPVVMAIKW